MSFFSNIKEQVKAKIEQGKDTKEFMELVDQETKPIRRAAYLEQKKRDAIEEGRLIAIKENQKKLQVQKRPEDFGISEGLNNPYKYINSKEDKKWI